MKRKGRRLAIGIGLVAVVVLGIASWLTYPHLRFWYLFEPLRVNPFGFREYRHRQTGIVMVRLPGGKFWMGAQRTDPKGRNYDPEAQDDEGPVHEVTLSPFLIGKFEVTQAQWKTVMGKDDPRYEGEDLKPVTYVSPNSVHRFEAQTGLMMPTEAQWEYACRGGSSTSNRGGTTQPVGPNGFGIESIEGNVGQIFRVFSRNRG